MKKRGQNGGLRGHYVALLKWCNNFGRDRIVCVEAFGVEKQHALCCVPTRHSIKLLKHVRR